MDDYTPTPKTFTIEPETGSYLDGEISLRIHYNSCQAMQVNLTRAELALLVTEGLEYLKNHPSTEPRD